MEMYWLLYLFLFLLTPVSMAIWPTRGFWNDFERAATISYRLLVMLVFLVLILPLAIFTIGWVLAAVFPPKIETFLNYGMQYGWVFMLLLGPAIFGWHLRTNILPKWWQRRRH